MRQDSQHRKWSYMQATRQNSLRLGSLRHVCMLCQDLIWRKCRAETQRASPRIPQSHYKQHNSQWTRVVLRQSLMSISSRKSVRSTHIPTAWYQSQTWTSMWLAKSTFLQLLSFKSKDRPKTSSKKMLLKVRFIKLWPRGPDIRKAIQWDSTYNNLQAFITCTWET